MFKSLGQTPIQSGDAPPVPVPVSGWGGQALAQTCVMELIG